MHSSKRLSTSWWLDIALITAVLALLYFAFLGSRPLFVPDEGRYAEIAREMVESRNYVTPYLNGIKYFEKPILFYWLEAGMIKLGGLNLWSIRSINALLALFATIGTYITFRLLFNRRTALLGSFILSTSLLYVTMAHMISLDLPVTCFITLSLYCYLLTTKMENWHARRSLLWLSASFAGLAVLTKGLIGIVFPILIISSWLLLRRDWRGLKEFFLPSSMLIFFMIVAPWHILVGLYNPEFYYYYFIEQHFLRYATTEVGHYQPFWYFIPVAMFGFFPWIVFLPQALKVKLSEPYKLFFILWAGIIFIFFSFSNSKLIPYILPIMPPLAGLVALYLTQLPEKIKTFNFAFFIFWLSAILLASAAIYLSWNISPANYYFYAIASILICGASLSLLFLKKHIDYALAAMCATIIFSMILFFAGFSDLDTRSILPLASKLNHELTSDDEVIAYNQYYQDLPFYLKRKVSILNWKNEFAFGMKHQDTHEWMIDDALFWQRYHSTRRIFVVMSESEHKEFLKRYPYEKSCILAETRNTIVISNQKCT